MNAMTTSANQSAWQKLKKGYLQCEECLSLLVDESRSVNFEQLDLELNTRFLRLLSTLNPMPPVLPLLLWRNCYYLGSPVNLSTDEVQKLKDRTGSEIKIIPISLKSYQTWFQLQHLDSSCISTTTAINPLSSEVDSEDISEIAKFTLSKATDQLERIKAILSSALRNRASDIHMEPTSDGLRIRYRIDGVLRDITTLPSDIGRRVVVALKVMSNLDIAESRRPQDGRIRESYQTENGAGVGLDMRVSTLPCIGGEKVVIRLLPQENPFTDIDNLGFCHQSLEVYKSWLKQPQGMIIFTGPTGSGKTSTLYTSLQSVATESLNVTTVEDPVEYVLSGITQTQVHEAAGMTFAAGLRAILRQDPDVIMVGEVRDPETAETAVRAALTGHLVLTTMHTNDAVSAIPRLKDIGPDPGLVSDSLLGIVAQRLVRRVCSHCSQAYTPTEEELARVGINAKQARSGNWRRGKGCSKCFNSGYLGREAIVELLHVDQAVRQAIYEGNTIHLQRQLNSTNFHSFHQAAVEKVMKGTTTVNEIMRVLPISALQSRVATIMPTQPALRLNAV